MIPSGLSFTKNTPLFLGGIVQQGGPSHTERAILLKGAGYHAAQVEPIEQPARRWSPRALPYHRCARPVPLLDDPQVLLVRQPDASSRRRPRPARAAPAPAG